jgi:hypothetical protein
MKTNKAVAGHVGRTYKFGGDIQITVETLALPTLNPPPNPADDADKFVLKIVEKELDEFIRRRSQLRENIKSLYSLLWGQCTENMRNHFEALDDYEAFSDELNGLDLL